MFFFFFSLMLHIQHESPKGLHSHPGIQPSISILSASWQRGRDGELLTGSIKLLPKSHTHHLRPHLTGQSKSRGQSWVQPGRKVQASSREGNYGRETGIFGKQKCRWLQFSWKKGCRYQAWVSSAKNNNSSPPHRWWTLPQNLSPWHPKQPPPTD